MNRIAFLAVASALLLTAGQSQALTVTNRDTAEQSLQITETGAPASRMLVVAPGQTVEDLCPAGCDIALANGTSASFDGNEVVDIRNGGFVVAE